MSQLLISYAHADSSKAATELNWRLRQIGYKVWRDIESLRAGRTWQQQLGDAIRTSDVLLVLLSPAAVLSKYVEWEWTTALFVFRKPVIPILILQCDIPAELSRLQYRDFSQADKQNDEYDLLIRDLNDLQTPTETATPPTAKYTVVGGQRVVIGDRALGIFGSSIDTVNNLTSEKLQRLRQLRQQIDSEKGGATYDVREVREAVIGDNAVGVYEAQALDKAILLSEMRSLLEDIEQRLLIQILSRIDTLEPQVVAEIRDAIAAIEYNTVSENELREVLAELQCQLIEMVTQKALYEDIALAQYAQDAVEDITAPGTDVRYRLKVTVPILFPLLAYEGEIELNIRANLEALWERIKGWKPSGDTD
ncbi:MAG TPA: toll/interleukin-1 receptor domain-containing protein [Aggregatilinea sp.]|uniref:toll/interleukin-1 receptor domain-containing protein n=1 Tax=Aggregatilinea sp. TaxID=2806333 RepID=UPI002BCB7543|nr:toll/interleukin-1 receptor domain-containing protein [Aggregatilinea sp.]HML22179.1 toll/interleukin-1 receptor domain-containing protein [Aggregatilinea sp.]